MLFSACSRPSFRRSIYQRVLAQEKARCVPASKLTVGPARFTYVESWKAIEIANSIFGFDGWSCSIVDISTEFVRRCHLCCSFSGSWKIEETSGRSRVGVSAIVRVTLKNGTFHEDTGFGISENRCKGSAIENAKKEAVSDARKRALRCFGNALGNTVYDRDYIDQVKVPQKRGTEPIRYDAVRARLSGGSADPLGSAPGVPAPPRLQCMAKTSPVPRPPAAGPLHFCAPSVQRDAVAAIAQVVVKKEPVPMDVVPVKVAVKQEHERPCDDPFPLDMAACDQLLQAEDDAQMLMAADDAERGRIAKESVRHTAVSVPGVMPSPPARSSAPLQAALLPTLPRPSPQTESEPPEKRQRK